MVLVSNKYISSIIGKADTLQGAVKDEFPDQLTKVVPDLQ